MPFETPDLLPAEAHVPKRLEAEDFVVRPLTTDDADMDYEAVASSCERLRGTFGPSHEWPPSDLTPHQNRVDVAWHHKEFQRRDAFTYTVVDPDEEIELGCVYVQPTRAQDYEAAVYYWVSTTADERGLADKIGNGIRRWLRDDWQLEPIAYPGRDISWSEWSPTNSDM